MFCCHGMNHHCQFRWAQLLRLSLSPNDPPLSPLSSAPTSTSLIQACTPFQGSTLLNNFYKLTKYYTTYTSVQITKASIIFQLAHQKLRNRFKKELPRDQNPKQYVNTSNPFQNQKINCYFLMNSQITCPHCKQVYSEDNPPKTLVNCPHNVCLKCLKEQILCPVDRVRIQLRRFTLQAFKTNQTLLSKVDKGNKSPEKAKSSRSKKSTPTLKLASKDKTIKSSSKKVVEEPKQQQQVVIAPFEDHIEVQILPPELSNVIQQSEASPQIIERKQTPQKIERKQSFSPKKPAINFQTCLLHSKKADLICMEDKGLICANCGLFGQHKHHTIIPYDNFLNQYSLLTEQCFRNYEELQSRQEKMNTDIIENRINELLGEKKIQELKQIRNFIRQLNNLVKNVEKDLISNLDVAINFKKTKLLESLSFDELISKKNDFMQSVDTMTQGLQNVFNLENIEQYIPFIDPNDSHSYVLEEGEYLIRQIDNYSKVVEQRIEDDVAEFKMAFSPLKADIFNSFMKISSLDEKSILVAIEKNKKEQQLKASNSVRNGTPSRMKSCKDTTVLLGKSAQKPPKAVSPPKQNQDNTLLLGLDSYIEGQPMNYPMQPLSNVSNIEFSSTMTQGCDVFFKVPETLHTNINLGGHSTAKKKKIPVNKSLNPSKTHLRMESCENELSQSIVRPRSKQKSTNHSNNMTQRELLNVLSEKSDNKRKKKLDLPEKFAKIYDDLHKDKVEILDLGGGFLGDNQILAISELFPYSKNKLKQVKLMNNKISDDIFAELMSRCRSVTSINLSYNCLTQKCLDWLEYEAEHLGDLRNITLSNNKIILRNNRQRIEDLKRRGLTVSL